MADPVNFKQQIRTLHDVLDQIRAQLSLQKIKLTECQNVLSVFHSVLCDLIAKDMKCHKRHQRQSELYMEVRE